MHIKEDLLKFKKSQTETSANGEVTIKVEKPSTVEDIDKNNIESQVKMTIVNNKTKESTSAVIKMYHTNQSIHLQGGKRMGMVTSTSLLADCLERHWKNNITNNIEGINEANNALKSMVLNPGMVLRARTSSGDNIIYCEKCNYTCSLKHQLNMHMMSKHGDRVKPLKINAIKRKSPPNKSPENQRPTKGKINRSTKSVSFQTDIVTDISTEDYTCNECKFVYSSKTDLACHISLMHADIKSPPDNSKQDSSSIEVLPTDVTNDSPETKTKEVQDQKVITEHEVEKILTNMEKEEASKRDNREKEEFLDKEKEKLYIEAENWRKTAQDLDIDLKSALKSNEKLLKDRLNVEEDYKKVTAAAGHLQQKVHTLEEEVKEMKLKSDLDSKEKEKAQIALEELQLQLDQEGVPMCPICNKRFPTSDVLQGHIDIVHHESSQVIPTVHPSVSENSGSMEHSRQTGYGITENYQLVSVQCKKCDETLENNHLLRIHMKKHIRKEQEVLKCTNCDYESFDENSYLNHIVDVHSTIHLCQNCGNKFPTKEELIGHIVREHRTSKLINNSQALPTDQLNTQDQNQQQDTNQIKCFNCGIMVKTKNDLMKHKKEQHWKQKPCSYYQSWWGCRFPDRVCFNYHRLEEQQQGPDAHRSQEQEVRGQEQRQQQEVRGQEQRQQQGAGGNGRVSWAGVTRGQREQGQGQEIDARANIDCRDGIQCRYNREGGCRYRHNNNQTNQYEQQTNTTNTTNSDESSFNMQEMKLTLDNLVKVVYNLKSLADFPKVSQQTKTT